MKTLLTSPPGLPLIAPSILSADFAEMGAECAHALEAGGDLLHLDVMDGHFVPNLTMGPDMCRALRRALPEAFLDVHLMVTDPAMFVEPFVEAGADHLTFHIEAMPAGRERETARELAARIRSSGISAGLSLNPPTSVERVLDVLDAFEMVLVMSVHPGYSGQAFMPEALAKARRIRERAGTDLRVQMDGGIGTENASAVLDAGCDVLVSASAIFGMPRGGRAEVIERLRGGAGG